MKRVRAWWIVVLILTGFACRLTSPTPASWAGTSTEEARAITDTVIAETAQSLLGRESTLAPLPTLPAEIISSPTPSPPVSADGPWLVFPGSTEGTLQAYDVDADVILEINLPPPIYFTDLTSGRSPQGDVLVLRAGSPNTVDELAIYQIDLPSTEAVRISPLLSLDLQRRIVTDARPRDLNILQVVTREGGLAWSPNGRYLAFTAALDNASSDLYIFDSWRDRVERLNGLFSQNASPFWSPGGNWLVSQEHGNLNEAGLSDAENVTALRVPGYDDQNTLYLPPRGSQSEVFLGWLNAQRFFSYSITADGPRTLREVNVESLKSSILYDGLFVDAAFDPETQILAFIVEGVGGSDPNLVPGIYRIQPESVKYDLVRAGEFNHLTWDLSGMFVASGSSGVFAFPPDGIGIYLEGEEDARFSPNGNWLIAWGSGKDQKIGARLYQPPMGAPLQTLLESAVEAIFWQPDSLGFFVLSEGSLYRLVFPGLNAQEIIGGIAEGTDRVFVWIE